MTVKGNNSHQGEKKAQKDHDHVDIKLTVKVSESIATFAFKSVGEKNNLINIYMKVRSMA